ncbi:hypothetical protein HRbin06_00139 [archaeon HR06]|nr:hypothetical protein HRbin06_00139 [archaeon HR06]
MRADGATFPSVNTNLPGAGNPATVVLSDGAGPGVDYHFKPSYRWGDGARIRASVTIGGVTYSGQSDKLVTGLLAGSVTWTLDPAPPIRAGGKVSITLTLGTFPAGVANQIGVPVELIFTAAVPSIAEYKGTLEAKTGVTDANSQFKTNLIVDTKAGRSVTVGVKIKAPTNADPNNVFQPATTTGAIATIAGPASKLQVILNFQGVDYTPDKVVEVFPAANSVTITVNSVDNFDNPSAISATDPTNILLTIVNVRGTPGGLNPNIVVIGAGGTTTGPAATYVASTNIGDEARIQASGGGLTGTSALIRTVSSIPKVSIFPVKAFVNTKDVTLEGWANVTVSGRTIQSVEFSLDGGAFNTIAGAVGGASQRWSVTLSNLAEGSHTVTIRATDSANERNTASVTFFVDTVNPTITITSPAAGAKITGDLMLEATLSDPSPSSGIDPNSLVVKVDGNVVTATLTDNKVTYRATLAVGSHTVTIDVKDRAGNSATTASVSFSIEAAVAGTATFAKPDVVETTGTDFRPAPVKPNTAFFVHAKYTNKAASPQEVIMYVQIKDAAGVVVYISALKTTVDPNKSAEAFLGPATGLPAGRYTAETFVWDAKTLTPLGEKGELTIVIS